MASTAGAFSFAGGVTKIGNSAIEMSMTVDILTPEQVAEALGCEPGHVNALAASHRLPGVKFGRSWRFPASALTRFLDEQAMANLMRPSQAPAMGPIKKHPRGKPRPNLMQAMTDAGMSPDEQLTLIRETLEKV